VSILRMNIGERYEHSCPDIEEERDSVIVPAMVIGKETSWSYLSGYYFFILKSKCYISAEWRELIAELKITRLSKVIEKRDQAIQGVKKSFNDGEGGTREVVPSSAAMSSF
jgi:hypothetical protein